MAVTSRYNASRRRILRQLGFALAVAGLRTLGAQSPVAREAALLVDAAADARRIGTILPGSRVTQGAARGAWVQVTINGYLDAGVLAGKADTFPRSARSDGVRVRAEASAKAPIVAQLRRGTGVSVLGTAGTFVKIRRTAWVRREALMSPSVASPAPTGGVRPVPVGAREATPALVAEPAPNDAAASVPEGALKPGTNGATLTIAPEARGLATLKPGAVLTPLARDRGWVRVRLEGWVRERELVDADSATRGMRSAADLRADPEGTKGAVVRWLVDVLGFQTADGLRRDLSDGEPYVLARGPDGEEALLYLAVPPSLVATARGWPPMSRALITARVRIGRSEPTGVPVLDLQTMTKP